MAKKAKKAKAAPKSAKSGAKSKRQAGKRDLVKAKNATMFAKRTAAGEFKEMDEVGRSLKADRRTKAKRKAKSGFGDRGDR
jgi:hypothetical protein